MKLIPLLLLAAMLLSGCALFAEKPNNAIAFTSDQIVNMAIQIERAQQNNIVSEEDGDKYLGLLLKANQLLGDTSVIFSEIEGCTDSTTKFQCIDAIMANVEVAIQ